MLPTPNRSPMNLSSWDGTLSSREFSLAARAFADKWKRFNCANPRWSWILLPNLPLIASHEVEGYLSMEKMCFLRPGKEDDAKKEPISSSEEEPSDIAMLVQSCDDEVHYYDFHILYSSSYGVPMLYFRAYCSDGQSLLLHDIEKYLPTNSAKLMRESKWTFITLEEHPYLNRPWYRLHPCGTSEWMKLLLLCESRPSKNAAVVDQYLSSWLSVVGQVFDLRIPIELMKSSH